MESIMKLGATQVLGIVYWDINGKPTVIQPHPEVKKQLEEYFDVRNSIQIDSK